MKANIIYLDIPFSEKDEAIRLAGKLQGGSNALGFNRENKVWFANQGADLTKLYIYQNHTLIKHSQVLIDIL